MNRVSNYLCDINSVKVAAFDSMDRLKHSGRNIWENFQRTKTGRALKNKFVFTSVLFIIWLLIFDQNNLSERRKAATEYQQLVEERAYYLKKIEEDRKRINELKTNTDNLEKFAREQYLMKKDNEDIFVIVED